MKIWRMETVLTPRNLLCVCTHSLTAVCLLYLRSILLFASRFLQMVNHLQLLGETFSFLWKFVFLFLSQTCKEHRISVAGFTYWWCRNRIPKCASGHCETQLLHLQSPWLRCHQSSTILTPFSLGCTTVLLHYLYGTIRAGAIMRPTRPPPKAQTSEGQHFFI